MRLSIVALALANVAALPVPKASFLRGAREHPCQIRHRRDALDVGEAGDDMLATEGTYNYLMGGGGDDRVFAYGNDNQLGVCPASSLLTALDLVFFRRATATSAG